jgi:predicted DNA-binding transcriptional regulator AlpA
MPIAFAGRLQMFAATSGDEAMNTRQGTSKKGIAEHVSPFGPSAGARSPANPLSHARSIALRVGKEKAPQPPPAAFSVSEFCQLHRISRALFYIMLRDGRGPRIMKIGKRTLVSAEAAVEWRRNLEAASAGAR